MFGRSVSRFVVGQAALLTRAPVAGSSAWSAVTARHLLAVSLMLTPAPVLRAESAAPTQSAEVRVPQSSQDHTELARLYQKLAAQQRAHADSLHRSLAAQIQRIAVAPNKTGIEPPWVTKLKRELQPEISQAETAAAEAERSADYHRMRAKELAGLEFAMLASVSPGEPR